jgi:PHD/YefM family antitoxin component YafN of YafNO toxin-antitoxin module
MSDKTHPSFDVSVVAPALESLHGHITRTKGRIEISRPGTDERCVLISKEELACLEHAIELLSETDSYRAIANQVAAVAADCVQAS